MPDFLASVISFFLGLSQAFFDGATGVYEAFTTDLSIDSILRLIIIYAFVIWAAFVIWVIKDITNRTTSILLQVFAILLVIALTPLFGLPIYLLIRPSSTIFERAYYEEEDDDAAPERAAHACPKCSYIVEERFKYCPSCGFECVSECSSCGERIREGRTPSKHCPYCGKPRKATAAEVPVSSPFVASLPAVQPDMSVAPMPDLAPLPEDPAKPQIEEGTFPTVQAHPASDEAVSGEASTVEILKFSRPDDESAVRTDK